MSLKSQIGKNVGTLSLAVMLALSLGLNVYLARRVDFRRPAPFNALRENAKLPAAISLLDADGKSAELSFSAYPSTVIYVFSPECPWCRRNEANIRALVAAAGARYRMIGISTVNTNLKSYIAEGHTPFPVYVMKSPDQMRQLGLAGTPETLVVGADGRVEKVWTGAYLTPTRAQVEKYFNITLPGMKSDPAAGDAGASANGL